MRILDFGKCNPFGTAKAGERFAKELRKGGSWELLFSTTFIYTYNYLILILLDILLFFNETLHLIDDHDMCIYVPMFCTFDFSEVEGG